MTFNFAGLSTGRKILLVASLLLFIDSFLQWQQVSLGPLSVGVTEWHGVGVLAALLVIALLLWEVLDLLGVLASQQLPVPARLVSVGLAAAAVLFTIIKFFVASSARHWPAWIGLILAIAIAIGAWFRLVEAPAAEPVSPTT